ncbi:MAG: Acetyl esterase [Phycisphaerae bacterium]|nr:Acetyl esterase [Phycisphaerae bacterium]
MMRTPGSYTPLDAIFQAERQAYDQPAAPPDAPFLREQVTYAHAGGRDLPAMLYRPRRPSVTLWPAVVYLHGGGWQGGDRGQFARHAAFLTTLGIAGLCVTYRLSGEACWPACFDDARAAVAWLREHADELGVDGRRIASCGGSAGGHLAALLAVRGAGASAVAAAVCFNPVLRVPRGENGKLARESEVKLLGGGPDEMPDRYREASPLAHVSPACPPMLLLHGQRDEIVSIEDPQQFEQAMRRVGARCELEAYPDVGHGWFNRSPHFERTLERMIEFLRANL